MTNRDKLVEIMLRYPRALCDHCGDDNWLEANAQQFADHLIASGIEKVVYCDDCVNRGHCSAEDTFRFVRMQKPFCAAGKAKEGAGND